MNYSCKFCKNGGKMSKLLIFVYDLKACQCSSLLRIKFSQHVEVELTFQTKVIHWGVLSTDRVGGRRPKTVPLTTFSVTIFLHFNLKQNTVFTTNVGHIWFLFLKNYKPNYSKKQRFFIIIFTYLRYYTSPKWPWSTEQASTVHFRHETSLLSTQWSYWTGISTSGK